MSARLFVEDPLAGGVSLSLNPGQAHYLAHVMRLGRGQALALFNGRDGEWRVVIEGFPDRRCQVRIEERLRPQAAEPDPWLAFAPIKKRALDFLVEKATELGVSRLLPVFTRHTSVTRVNLERMRANAVEAAQQCRRLTVPGMAPALSLEDLLGGWPPGRPLLVLDETGGGRDLAGVATDMAAAGAKGESAVGFLVGPEGGFSGPELDALGKLPFVTMVGVGPRILRAETAALSALALWQGLAGDWRHRPTRQRDP